MGQHEQEVTRGDRFEFGKNWANFLRRLDESRIERAAKSLLQMLAVPDLKGSTFLDIGSGSGLFSLAARRLGAKVHSFDFDPNSVACTTRLRDIYFPNDPNWVVEEGSVLNSEYMNSLGQFDITYSWGVLHHTGDMWLAIGNAIQTVNPNGLFFLAIYNDQGALSRRWKKLKRIYNLLPRYLRLPYAVLVMGLREIPPIFWAIAKLNPSSYLRSWTNYAETSTRGMSRWHDLIDWIGGYPFEVARPEEIFEFFRRRDFQLQKLRTRAGGIGCNEFIFRRSADIAGLS